MMEDLQPHGDVTTQLIKNKKKLKAKIISNQKGIIGGLNFAREAFKYSDKKINFKANGSTVKFDGYLKVYKFEDEQGRNWSEELCGGPHAESTGALQSFGRFKIKKEESSSAGVRRIKAVLIEN